MLSMATVFKLKKKINSLQFNNPFQMLYQNYEINIKKVENVLMRVQGKET